MKARKCEALLFCAGRVYCSCDVGVKCFFFCDKTTGDIHLGCALE